MKKSVIILSWLAMLMASCSTHRNMTVNNSLLVGTWERVADASSVETTSNTFSRFIFFNCKLSYSMKCKYCKADVSPFKFYFHLACCRRERRKLINQKINRHLTIPDEALLKLLRNNLSRLNNDLLSNKSYQQVLNCDAEKLSLKEAIAINKLFWHAYTPWYGDSLAPGWLNLVKLEECDGKLCGVCYDWRTFPPDLSVFPINMIPAEIIAEALEFIDITTDTESFKSNPSYQPHIK